MRLQAWREIWMWLAISACGGSVPSWVKESPPTKVSVFDAPPFAGATYFATAGRPIGRKHDPVIGVERGRFACEDTAETSCVEAKDHALRSGRGFAFIDGGAGGRWFSATEVLAAAMPIDTPAKALLAVWTTGKYELGWGDGKRYHGGQEDGRVRSVDGGFEVAGSMTEGPDCGGSVERPLLQRTYRVTLFVDARGSLTMREQVETARDKITQACHNYGRRPADFVDVACEESVEGYLARVMHHEAESVRAFVRLARELHAHGAPPELVSAAEQAARDERDHARRCGELLGIGPTIQADELPLRSLRELAIDNATEGCVGESYAALAAVVQAHEAATAELRAHFAAIAVDELAHAALAHAIAAWLDTVVTDEDRSAIARERERALSALEQELAIAPDAVAVTFGVPQVLEARRLTTLVRALATE